MWHPTLITNMVMPSISTEVCYNHNPPKLRPSFHIFSHFCSQSFHFVMTNCCSILVVILHCYTYLLYNLPGTDGIQGCLAVNVSANESCSRTQEKPEKKKIAVLPFFLGLPRMYFIGEIAIIIQFFSFRKEGVICIVWFFFNFIQNLLSKLVPVTRSLEQNIETNSTRPMNVVLSCFSQFEVLKLINNGMLSQSSSTEYYVGLY